MSQNLVRSWCVVFLDNMENSSCVLSVQIELKTVIPVAIFDTTFTTIIYKISVVIVLEFENHSYTSKIQMQKFKKIDPCKL